MEHRYIRTAAAWWNELNPVFFKALAGLGIDARLRSPIADSVRLEYLRPETWRVSAGAPRALTTLSEAGWKHAIISNHVPELPDLVTELGLAPFFERVFSSALMGVEKPNPAFLEEVLATLGCRGAAWVIGDSIQADIAAARAAGLPSLLIGSSDPLADHCVTSVSEVPGVAMASD